MSKRDRAEERYRKWKEIRDKRNEQRHVSVWGTGRTRAGELAEVTTEIVEWKTRRDGIKQRYHYKAYRPSMTRPEQFRFDLGGRGLELRKSVALILQHDYMPRDTSYLTVSASEFNSNPDKYATIGKHIHAEVKS